MSETINIAQPRKQPPKRLTWFAIGTFFGILLMIVFANSPDRIAHNYRSWLAVFVPSAVVPPTNDTK